MNCSIYWAMITHLWHRGAHQLPECATVDVHESLTGFVYKCGAPFNSRKLLGASRGQCA